MKRALLLLFLFALSPLPVSAASAPVRPPVVVELYTAQGCSSCRVANDHLAEMADEPGVLALTFAVDYWDYLGWPDTFAQPAFSERQKTYAKRMDVREVYTPQVIVDGRYQTGGVKADKVDALVSEAAGEKRDPPDMLFMNNGRVAVGSGRVPRGGADVWMIRYDPRSQEITPRKGDNRGETLMHRNVVREIVRLGAWTGRPTAYKTPKAEDEGLRTVVLLQAAKGGKIMAVLTDKAKD